MFRGGAFFRYGAGTITKKEVDALPYSKGNTVTTEKQQRTISIVIF